MSKSPNVPNKVMIRQSSKPINYHRLRNIVKLMITENLKKEMEELKKK